MKSTGINASEQDTPTPGVHPLSSILSSCPSSSIPPASSQSHSLLRVRGCSNASSKASHAFSLPSQDPPTSLQSSNTPSNLSSPFRLGGTGSGITQVDVDQPALNAGRPEWLEDGHARSSGVKSGQQLEGRVWECTR